MPRQGVRRKQRQRAKARPAKPLPTRRAAPRAADMEAALSAVEVNEKLVERLGGQGK